MASPLLPLFLFLAAAAANPAAAAACFSSIFSFGDSISDTGNYLISCGATPDPVGHPPYGETFFHRPTGRCSDGRLIVDFLAQALGLPLVPPYLSGETSPEGANFAVAGCTALDNEFFRSLGLEISGSNYSLGVQMEWFRQLLPSICSSYSECRNLMANSLFLVGEIGGNDYCHSLLQGRAVEEVKAFVPDVISAISSAITELIRLGARTLVVPGGVTLGCLPIFLDHFRSNDAGDYEPETGCLKFLNRFSEHHNEMLLHELNQIRQENPDATIIYADYYNAMVAIFRNPQRYGFRSPLLACCGGGGEYNYNASAVCGDEAAAAGTVTACRDPAEHVNWDGVHFTEAGYRAVTSELLGRWTEPSVAQICPQIDANFSQGIHAPI
ncbi:GDSL esterase/lipase At1g28580-like [Curcuma longa]|uniref:GDSL esterase/lipase At1g28580-like n=1 Tax=Curcuma longa TaxID=136217 RepID=UPI003D9F671B